MQLLTIGIMLAMYLFLDEDWERSLLSFFDESNFVILSAGEYYLECITFVYVAFI